MLLHLAGPDVQEIFTTLTDTGNATYRLRPCSRHSKRLFRTTSKLGVCPPDLSSDHTETR